MAELETTTRLAVARTALAANRTLMSWIRTAISMISFGFTIYKVIQGLEEGVNDLVIDLQPVRAGLILIGLAILSIIIGMIEYYLVMREIRMIMAIRYWGHTLWLALLVLLVAIALFVSIAIGAL
jgi:putative membrane protein